MPGPRNAATPSVDVPLSCAGPTTSTASRCEVDVLEQPAEQLVGLPERVRAERVALVVRREGSGRRQHARGRTPRRARPTSGPTGR